MRQGEHTFSFHLQLISGSVTYLSIVFTSFCRALNFANSWWWEIQKFKIDDKEREKKKKIMATLGSPIFLQSLHFIFKTQKQNDRQN